jgi:hypothetical protein
MRRVLGMGLLLVGAMAFVPTGAGAQDGCYHDYTTNEHVCPEPTTAPATSPTTKAPTVITRAPARASATTAPKAAARTAATVAATTTTVAPTTTTILATTTTAAVTINTEPVAKQGVSSNTAPAIMGAVVAAALTFGAFQLISRRRSSV